jgi:hypothetical protein
VKKYLFERGVSARNLEIEYRTDDPKAEFLLAMKKRIYGAAAHNWDYSATASEEMQKVFAGLESNTGAHNSYLPQASFVNVIGPERDEVYSLVRNSGYSNIAQLFKEDERRLPAEDNLTITSGFLGAYPNYFFMVNEKELDSFAQSIASLGSEADYRKMLDLWGVHRTDPWFWRVSDKFHRMIDAGDPVTAGLLDYNRYHARSAPGDNTHRSAAD